MVKHGEQHLALRRSKESIQWWAVKMNHLGRHAIASATAIRRGDALLVCLEGQLQRVHLAVCIPEATANPFAEARKLSMTGPGRPSIWNGITTKCSTRQNWKALGSKLL